MLKIQTPVIHPGLGTALPTTAAISSAQIFRSFSNAKRQVCSDYCNARPCADARDLLAQQACPIVLAKHEASRLHQCDHWVEPMLVEWSSDIIFFQLFVSSCREAAEPDATGPPRLFDSLDNGRACSARGMEYMHVPV